MLDSDRRTPRTLRTRRILVTIVTGASLTLLTSACGPFWADKPPCPYPPSNSKFTCFGHW